MSSSQGWISLSRKVRDCWIWQDKPFSKGQAWVDMLLSANHEDRRFLLGNELVEVKRGSFITSEHKLMDKWGWSKTKVRAFLLLLENDSMIVKISDKKKTTINIVNYSDYQDSRTTKEPQKDHEETTKEPQKDPNNNENNDNNVNKNNKDNSLEYEKRYSDDSFEIKCVRYLIKSIKDEMPNAKLPSSDEQIDKWCDNIEKMVRLDKRTQDDIYNTLVFARTDSFWKVNIRSTSKFREKYETLFLQSKNKKNINNQSTGKINKFNAFPQREYSKEDYLSMEQRLLNRG